jgi:DNA repair exonuclease SbcCD nuclease subunit
MEISFIHTADLHLCNSFENLLLSEKERVNRRKELWETFDKIIDFTIENESDYLFISGDIICSRYAKLKDFERISEKFKLLNKTKVILTAGNNDPFKEESYYSITEWPSNVYIIKETDKLEKIDFIDDNLCIYGISLSEKQEGHYLNSKLDVDINKDKINILVMHGGREEKGHPLYVDYEKLKKFDYCALGHEHNHTEIEENIIYPGTPEPLDFEEEGKRGVVMGKVSKDMIFKVFIPLAKRKFVTKEVNLQKDYTKEKILDIVKFLGDVNSLSRDFYRVVFKGELNHSIKIQEIIDESQKYFRYIEFKEDFEYNLEMFQQEQDNRNNIIGRYINEMTKKRYEDLFEQKSVLVGLEELYREKVES